MANAAGRRGYVDWVRGLAVLVMIQAHVLDSWTRLDARHTSQFAWAMIVGGFGAPLFLFLAGVSVALSAGSKSRRTRDDSAAAIAVMKRGGWIFLLAFVFRVQAWILGWGAMRSLLKVDILNVMGPSIAVAAALWGAPGSPVARATALGAAATVVSLITPIVRASPILDVLPDPLEAYVRPLSGYSSFCVFPWAAFVLAGACVGLLLDQARISNREARLNTWLALAGVGLASVSYAASFLPSPYAHSEFWGGSPAFFAIRAGVITAIIPLAYWWKQLAIRPTWSPMEQLGRSSLFIYWIHVEMVYGLISLRIHKTLTHAQAWAAYVAFVLLMLLLSIEKDRIVRWRRMRGGRRSAYLIESSTF
jgi:uncharacterized membrane protein